MSSSPARGIPSIERLRQSPRAQVLEARYGRAALVSALRAAADSLRAALATSEAAPASGADAAADADAQAETGVKVAAEADADARETRLIDDAAARLSGRFQSHLRAVINATGVIIHTNLGRAPLAAEALARVQAIGAGYASIEYDLDDGRRGRRDRHAEPLLRDLTGAGAAIIVNNNAAAVLLILTALAQGREVLISRGELVEIGGGFRVPDVMRQSGALLREVGTTNRTRVADYAASISDRTALILRVHPSNFVIEGFTERPDLRALTALGRQFNVPVVEDIGSGYFGGIDGLDEPDVPGSLRAGVDVVTFSGDKLLGGPQAGIIAGRPDLVDIMRRHPLMRALRVDKLTYAALEGTLVELARGRGTTEVPVLRMLSARFEDIAARTEALVRRLTESPSRQLAGEAKADAEAEASPDARPRALRATTLDGWSAIGGGSAPGTRLPTRLVALDVEGIAPDDLLRQLRGTTPPVIARIEEQRVVLDLRTVTPEQDEQLAALLLAALSAFTRPATRSSD
jgi:L-seryl-tRNA(Ser) seleniumtransferase